VTHWRFRVQEAAYQAARCPAEGERHQAALESSHAYLRYPADCFADALEDASEQAHGSLPFQESFRLQELAQLVFVARPSVPRFAFPLARSLVERGRAL
jgi:hypothetical protein